MKCKRRSPEKKLHSPVQKSRKVVEKTASPSIEIDERYDVANKENIPPKFPAPPKKRPGLRGSSPMRCSTPRQMSPESRRGEPPEKACRLGPEEQEALSESCGAALSSLYCGETLVNDGLLCLRCLSSRCFFLV